jgi:hypothetical protein
MLMYDDRRAMNADWLNEDDFIVVVVVAEKIRVGGGVFEALA